MREIAPLKHSYPTRAGDRHRATGFRSRLCAGMLCAGTLLLPAAGHAADNKQQLETVQQNILAKEKSVQQQQKQRTALLGQLKEQEQSISRSSRALRDTQHTLATLKGDIDRLTRSIRQLQDRQAAQQKLLAQQLDAAFRQGQHSGLQLILSNEESLRSERILAYFSYLNEARTKTINDLRQTRTDLAAQKREQQQKQQQQQQVLQQQQKQQQTLQGARAARQKTLSGLNSSIAEDKQRLAELHQNEARLRDSIARAEREAKARAQREAREAQRVREREAQAKSRGSTYKPSESERALVARTGGLGRPAGQDLWPVRGRTLHRFGEPQQGELRYKGLVIAAAEGSEVKAIAAGRVLMADWLQGYGLMVVIEHGKGDMSLYGYNQSALVNVGDQVKAEQPIALVGASGGQGTPSLYFEIRRQGQAVNPIPWLGR
ncbi:murein hydrolase activator EnvC [Candidatus Sodalis sp. SoCistrobi]|uniref:murein hydrolase activator EnvC n=1 Tax=Candidatus Sodalis sp. SoCistrobi TaxID=1922216 RepID=UPI00093E2CFE|nr:murein hydrolase activator EnvC [Candidatus Sodalis sp. SoCistrobi]